jgi:glutathione S-transferase
MAEAVAADDARSPGESADDRTLVIERVFKAPPEAVFHAWTDPAILVQWWGPETFTTSEPEMDVRPGGAWRTVMVGPKGETHTASGVYREITPPKRLVMSWAWQQDDGGRGHETEVEVNFEPTSAGTRMRLVQRLFQSRQQRDNHFGGWTSTFKDLERLFGGP